MDEEYVEDYPDEVTLSLWPDCIVQGCPNKCCLRLKSPYCFPHTWTDETVNEVLERLEMSEAAVK